MLHDATTALEDTVYLFICDGTVLYFDDDNFTGFTNWETIEKLKEQASMAKPQNSTPDRWHLRIP